MTDPILAPGGFLLEGVSSPVRCVIGPGRSWSVGRSLSCDCVIDDPTVSRHHARFQVGAEGDVLLVTDLESANGVEHNGVGVTRATCRDGDHLTVGRVTLRVRQLPAMPAPERESESPDLPDTLVREIPGDLTEQAILARLLDITRRLSGPVDQEGLLDDVLHLAFETTGVDRAAILLGDRMETLAPARARTRQGPIPGFHPPRAILRRALAARNPLVIDRIEGVPGLASPSVALQRVHGAVCCPLRAEDDTVLGVLYADQGSTAGITPAEARALFALGGIAAVTLARLRYATLHREEQVRGAQLARFFAPAVARAITDAPDQTLGAQCVVTVLFTDIRGFSEIAATRPPERVARVLTEYYTDMTDIIFAEDGTLDRFLGDGILAVWGAPIPREDASARALAAATAMLQALPELNARWRARGDPVLSLGAGLARGRVFAGTLGGPRRLDYTVIGEAVNLASRLATAAGPGQILLDTAVAGDLPPGADLLRGMARESVVIRGREEPVAIYRLVPAAPESADGGR